MKSFNNNTATKIPSNKWKSKYIFKKSQSLILNYIPHSPEVFISCQCSCTGYIYFQLNASQHFQSGAKWLYCIHFFSVVQPDCEMYRPKHPKTKLFMNDLLCQGALEVLEIIFIYLYGVPALWIHGHLSFLQSIRHLFCFR